VNRTDERIYHIGYVLENTLSNSITIVVAMMRNHNGLHLKTINLVNGNIGHLNDVETEHSKRHISILHYSLDEYLARNNVEDWIGFKIKEFSCKPYRY
jgi:hypothetical protein